MWNELKAMGKPLLKNRIVLFGSFFIAFIVANQLATGNLLPTTATKDLWFYSGIFMVLFSTLFIEPYYSSPKNVITNVVPLLLVFLAVENEFVNKNDWIFIVSAFILLLVGAVVSISIFDENKSPDAKVNKISEFLKNAVVLLGRGKVLFSGTFLYFLFTYYVSDQQLSGYVFFLLILWALMLLINPKELSNSFSSKKRNRDDAAIGEIFGVQSKRIFLVKLYDDRKEINRFNIVKFNYSMQDDDGTVMTGIVFDYYLLNKEKWAKVLQLGATTKKTSDKLIKNTVYKVPKGTEHKLLAEKLKINNFIGVVIDHSTIGRIKFEYSKKEDDLQEGDLVELVVGNKRLFYQVITGMTEKEKLENRNESGFIEGEAVQLGEWDSTNISFNKFGWVPEINTPIFKADTSDIKTTASAYPEFAIGNVPNTSLPSIINLRDAVETHTALIGVTGSGKSHLARKIISELVVDTKVVIVDFTAEWSKKLEAEGKSCAVLNKENLNDFLDDDDQMLGVVELPSLSNTSDVLKATERLFEMIFDSAKKKYEAGEPSRICLVLEEAHTITPETSFLGDLGDYGSSKALVNKMAQVALQGRKYGVGMLVIAQRTANVSKTVLTQCNTVICFQAFDETSFNFLGNYVGKDMITALPNLKQYHAIVTGRAVKSNVPMIINLESK